MDRPNSNPQVLALWVLNPVVFHPHLLLERWAQISPHTWLRLGAGDTGSSFTHCSWLWPYLQDQFLGGSCLLKSLQAPCHPQPLASSSLSLGGLTGRWEKGPLPVLWSCHGLLGKHSSLPGSLPPSGL